MKKITNIEEVMNEIEKSGYFGFRSATEHDMEVINQGRDYLDCSHDWIAGEGTMTEDFLPGSCAIEINEYMSADEIKERYDQTSEYPMESGVILLVGDSCGEYGNDENEIILGHNGCGADVIAIVEL